MNNILFKRSSQQSVEKSSTKCCDCILTHMLVYTWWYEQAFWVPDNLYSIVIVYNVAPLT